MRIRPGHPVLCALWMSSFLGAVSAGSRAEDRARAASLFGPSGELVAAAPVVASGPAGARDGTGFIPSIRVDDDINPEHREPAVAWGPGGVIYAAYCERATHYNPELVMFTRSTDGGSTWLAPAVRINDTAPNAVLFPAIDVTDGGTIAVVWSEMKFSPYNYEIRFSRSTDGGDTWSPSTVIHPLNPSVDYHRPSLLAVGGRILVSYWEEVSYPNGRPVAVYSDDAGESWSAPITVTATLGRYDGAAPCLAYNDVRGEVGLVMRSAAAQILYYKSSDTGENWSSGVQVNDVSPSSINYPDLACGGGYDYVVWNDNRNGQYDSDVWISPSADGVSFSADVKVNDDLTGNQYEPHVRVDSQGVIHVCWIWNIPFGADIDLYYSISDDGGAGWLAPSPRVNDVPYSVQPYVAWTSDLLTDPEGTAYLFWNDGRTTDYYDNIYFTRTIDLSTVDGEPAIPTRGPGRRVLSGRGAAHLLGHPGPDPWLSLELWRPVAGLRIDLVDVGGRLLGTVARGGFGAGKHTFRIMPNGSAGAHPAGTCFLRLTDGRDATGIRIVWMR